jgi:hypothetical protein
MWDASVSGTTIVVEENRFPTSFWTTTQGRDRPCSCPTTGSRFTSTTMPRKGFAVIQNLRGRCGRILPRGLDSSGHSRHKQQPALPQTFSSPSHRGAAPQPCESIRSCSFPVRQQRGQLYPAELMEIRPGRALAPPGQAYGWQALRIVQWICSSCSAPFYQQHSW